MTERKKERNRDEFWISVSYYMLRAVLESFGLFVSQN